MIAFVRYVSGIDTCRICLTGRLRLDTRKSAEDVIERLNGRVVRGRNDNGSRIAVRFADTPEQRELRVNILLTFLVTAIEICPFVL